MATYAGVAFTGMAATEKWDAILRAAQSMQSSTVVPGSSPNTPVIEEARIAGLAWEQGSGA